MSALDDYVARRDSEPEPGSLLDRLRWRCFPKHEPLCDYAGIFPVRGCFGCLLVELASDAHYSTDEGLRDLARKALAELTESIEAYSRLAA